jgi:uncharacterized protein YbaP (TraB family)
LSIRAKLARKPCATGREQWSLFCTNAKGSRLSESAICITATFAAIQSPPSGESTSISIGNFPAIQNSECGGRCAINRASNMDFIATRRHVSVWNGCRKRSYSLITGKDLVSLRQVTTARPKRLHAIIGPYRDMRCFLIPRTRKSCVHLLAAAILASAQNAVAAAPSSSGKHFLWRVTNARAPFYLLGSMHVLREVDYPLPGEIDRAIAQSQKIIFETNPNAAEAPSLRRRLRAAGRYPTGVTIDKKVSAPTFALLKRIAKARLSEYADRRPWAIAFFSLGGPPTKEFRSRLGMDFYAYKHARSGTEIAGLETVDESVHALSDMPDAAAESFLLESIALAARSRQLLVQTTEAWKAGDTQRMYRLYAPQTIENAYWNWVTGHHRIWVPRIEQALHDGKTTLVIAGALHFCGPRSLLAILRERGYTVEQL